MAFLLPALVLGVGAALGGAAAGNAITSAGRHCRTGVETAAQTVAESIDRASLGVVVASKTLQNSITNVCGAIAQMGHSHYNAAVVLGNYHLNAAVVLGRSAEGVAAAIQNGAVAIQNGAVAIQNGADALRGLNEAIVQAQHTLEFGVANLIDGLQAVMNLAGKWAVGIVVMIALGYEFRFGQGVAITQQIAIAFTFPLCMVPLFAFTWGFVFAIYTSLCRYIQLVNATQELKQRAMEVSLAMPGAILPFAGERLPAGYLFCDGAEYRVDQYPALYQAIGNAHGSSGDGLRFRVPDYRGRFLRGVDDDRSNRDPHRNSRGLMNAGGNVNGRVGSVQMITSLLTPSPVAFVSAPRALVPSYRSRCSTPPDWPGEDVAVAPAAVAPVDPSGPGDAFVNYIIKF